MSGKLENDARPASGSALNQKITTKEDKWLKKLAGYEIFLKIITTKRTTESFTLVLALPFRKELNQEGKSWKMTLRTRKRRKGRSLFFMKSLQEKATQVRDPWLFSQNDKYNLDPNGAIAKVIKEAEEVWKPFIKPDVRFEKYKFTFRDMIFRIKKGKRRDSTSTTDAEESEESSDESGHESDDEPLVAQVSNFWFNFCVIF